ncbi:MAG TPA: cytochrome c biogenesis protein [Deinococcales bacterium]|nr:cytochrome c biogenesis protein [Deinococcales bacterium]
MAVRKSEQYAGRPAWLTVFGWVALAGALVATWFALVVAPTEATQQELFRATYLHAATATIGLLGTVVTGVLGAITLWRGRREDDIRTVAAAEITTILLALTVFAGMIYSKPTLGAYWAWDARLTLSAIMLVLMAGYFIIRGIITEPDRAARVSAVIALVAAAGAPLNRAATSLFRTVHPARSAEMPAELSFVLGINMVAMLLLFAWFFLERSSIGLAEARLEARETDGDDAAAGEVIHV